MPVYAGGMEASFRGRPLKGCEVRVPQGYSAAVIGQKGDHVTCLGHFDGFVHWTLDNPPTADSRLVKALQWIELAEVVSGTLNHVNKPNFYINSYFVSYC